MKLVRIVWTLFMTLAVALATASCASTDRVPDSCPANAKFVAVWSSETHYSQLTFYDETGPIGQKRIDAKGLAPGRGFEKVGDEWVGFSNGNVQSDVSHIVRVNLATCELTKTRVEERGTFDYAADTDGVYVDDTSDWVAQVHAHLATGENVDAKFPDEVAGAITTSADSVLLFTSRINEPEKLILRALDKKTLREKWRIPVPAASVSANAKVIGDIMYFAEPYDATETPSNKLHALNLKTQKLTTTNLPEKLPYVLTSHDSTLYVGSTFQNPSFGPLEDMRTITAVDLATGENKPLTAEHGILQLEATKARLVVYGDYDSETNVAITSYKMPDFKPEYSFKLERPKGKGHMYGAGFLLLDE